MFTTAIVRLPGPDCAEGLTTADLGRADYPRMVSQHRAYVAALQRLGLTVEVLDPVPGCPDAYFVEDVAVVVPEVAVITRPGAASRQSETAAIIPFLTKHRPVAAIEPPGTLEGGDVLVVGQHVFIGLSERTNEDGARQLGQILAAHGYHWTAVMVGDGLHLKSSVSLVGKRTLLLTAALANHEAFAGYERIVIDDDEAYAANTLWVNERLLIPAGFPKTRAKLAGQGTVVEELEVSEVRKMDGGLTCMSLRF